MDLEISELSEVCSVLRTYISQAKRVNKKDRLKNALKKLEIELSYKEFTTYRNYLSGSPVTFRKNNLCPTCNQPKLTSTLKQELF